MTLELFVVLLTLSIVIVGEWVLRRTRKKVDQMSEEWRKQKGIKKYE